MKNKLVVLLFIFGFQNISHPQGDFTLGLKTGIIFNQYIISGDALKSFGSNHRTGLTIGLTTELYKSKHFMFMPEIYYLQRGMTYDLKDYELPAAVKRTSVSYISIAVLFAYRFTKKFVTPFVLAGPRVEHRLKYDEADLIGLYSDLNKANVGVTAGFGFEKEVMRGVNMTADFRYSRDLTGFQNYSYRVGNTYNGLGNNPFKYTNSSFDLLIGVNFKIGSSKNKQ